MIFASPALLMWLPAVALPVVFHLVLRRKRRRLVFSTFMFFHRADPRLNSRRQIREIVLLVLRVLFLLFMMLALSRPAIRLLKGLGGPASVAIVLDNSGSMSAPGTPGHTKLQLAVAGARALINDLDTRSEAAIILLVDDPTAELPEGMTSAKDELLLALGRVAPTEGTGDAADALNRALAILGRRAASMDRALAMHVFTDLQKAEWDQGVLKLTDVPVVAIEPVVHRVPSFGEMPANVAIQSVIEPPGAALPRRPYIVQVALRNDAPRAMNVRLNHEDSAGTADTQNVTVSPGGAKTLSVSMTPPDQGQHWMNIWIEGDEFSADNRASVGFVCRPPISVLFVGELDEFGLLPKIVSPAGDGRFTSLVPLFCEPDQLVDQREKNRPALLVTTWGRLTEIGADTALDLYLRGAVESGDSLLVLPSPAGPAPSAPPDWLGATAGPAETNADGRVIDVLDRRAAVWGALRDETGKVAIRHFTAHRFCPLTADSTCVPLIGPSFRTPLLVHRPMGKGHLFISGLAFDPAWSSMLTDPTGAALVLVHNMALQAAYEDRQRSFSVVAGRSPPIVPTPGAPVGLASVVGESVNLTLAPGTVPVFPRSGVYTVKEADNEYCISVRSSDREGQAEFVHGEVLNAFGERSHYVMDLDVGEGGVAMLAGVRAGQALYLPLLLLAIAVWLAEGWLASGHVSRTERNAKRGTVKS